MSRRACGRFLVLVAFVGAVFFSPAGVVRFVLPALSPFLFVSALLATRNVGWAVICAVPMLAIMFWRRRAVCHHVCPMGYLLDVCGQVRHTGLHTYSRVWAFGYWAALFTVGGAFASVPVFLFLDPMGILAGAVGGVRFPFCASRLPYVAGLAILAAMSVVFPSLWCRRLCPLGGLQDAAADLVRVVTRSFRETPVASGAVPLARRMFLGMGAGVTCAALGLPVHRHGNISLRPPGAAVESTLKTLCLRCGHCVQVCPTGVIHPSMSFGDPAGVLTPVLRFDAGCCLETCNRCGQGCPTGAIAALSIGEKNEAVIGVAEIDQAACHLSTGRECVACITVCTRHAIVEDFSPKTYGVVMRVAGLSCNGCGACVSVCPAHAIAVRVAAK